MRPCHARPDATLRNGPSRVKPSGWEGCSRWSEFGLHRTTIASANAGRGTSSRPSCCRAGLPPWRLSAPPWRRRRARRWSRAKRASARPGSGATPADRPASWHWVDVDLSPADDPADFYRAIGHALGLIGEGGAPSTRLDLADALVEAHVEGRRWVLVVDEAHNLSDGLLEEIRLPVQSARPSGRVCRPGPGRANPAGTSARHPLAGRARSAVVRPCPSPDPRRRGGTRPAGSPRTRDIRRRRGVRASPPRCRRESEASDPAFRPPGRPPLPFTPPDRPSAPRPGGGDVDPAAARARPRSRMAGPPPSSAPPDRHCGSRRG